MKRSDIKGFTVHGFGYSIEFVFIRYVLKVVAIYQHNIKLIKRWEVSNG